MISFNFPPFFFLLQIINESKCVNNCITVDSRVFRTLSCCLFFATKIPAGKYNTIYFEVLFNWQTVVLEQQPTRKLMTDTIQQFNCALSLSIMITKHFFTVSLFPFLPFHRLSVMPSALLFYFEIIRFYFQIGNFAACHRVWECNLMNMSMGQSKQEWISME